MFDKITIRATLSDEEAVHLAELHRLQRWENHDKTKVEYRSSQYSNTTGIVVKIIQRKLTIRLSLHKYWNERNFGKLRNDDMFTISEAKSAFSSLLFENGLIQSKVRIVQFEIGMNLNVSHNPLTFIELVSFVAGRENHFSESTSASIRKTMYIDANYHINRQKTTEKNENIRKYFKIYDKSFETAQKDKKNKKEVDTNRDPVLRIETVYKRHGERADKFFTDENIKRLVQRFYADWISLNFYRDVRAKKGARKSEVERATMIVNIGAEYYLKLAHADLEQGKITPKQYRTIREFVRDYNETHYLRFREIESPQEQEYKELFKKTFGECKI